MKMAAIRLFVVVAVLVGVCLSLPLDFKLPFSGPTNAQGGKNWAFLTAGSNTWDNYRHQADICHSYQVMHAHGIPDEQIIVMMYDDIAENIANPHKGIIVNVPGGPNVYPGVLKDYTKGDVNPKNFINVLKGVTEGLTNHSGTSTGRVLNTGPNDNIFVNFVDHGGPGIIAFPIDTLSAQELNGALEYMATNKRFNQLVFYLEACESGSMFNNILPNNTNIYATTAANPTTSSYACYFNASLGVYMGDVYSVNWMYNADTTDLSKETLREQYLIVKNMTNTSQVCEYGQKSLSSEMVAEFLGASHSEAFSAPLPTSMDVVDSRDVDLDCALRLSHANPTDLALQARVAAILEKRSKIEDTYAAIVSSTAGAEHVEVFMGSHHTSEIDFECYSPAIDAFHTSCFNYGQEQYALKYAHVLVNLCHAGYSSDRISQAIHEVCA